jgi:hypothetical protein
MNKYRFLKYSEEMIDAWDSFVSNAKNYTFLFQRAYMDYHSDRFDDASIMIYHNQKLLALLPANVKDRKLFSHQGLTYGGLVYAKEVKFRVVLEVFKELMIYLSKSDVETLQISLLPQFYSNYGNDEIDYMLHLCKSTLVKKKAFSVLNLSNNNMFSSNRLEGYKRGNKHELKLRYDDEIESFWRKILIPNLKDKYKSKPVHSIEEILLLKSRFPNNIIQVNIYNNNKLVAGTTLFVTNNVVRAQYISGNSDNNVIGCLDFLFYKLIKEYFDDKIYFDFGSSASGNLGNINQNLQYWKEGFGARTFVQNIYEVKTDNYKLLNNSLE